jgi:malate dehydrogenase
MFASLLKKTKTIINMKITVVGAGAVGATVADNIARRELCHELVLVDIKEGVAEGKAMDMNQTATLLGFDTKVVGSTNDYTKTAGSDVAVITSGIPRKPGMTREELIGTNASIVKSVAENIIKTFAKHHHCGYQQPNGYDDLPSLEINRYS